MLLLNLLGNQWRGGGGGGRGGGGGGGGCEQGLEQEALNGEGVGGGRGRASRGGRMVHNRGLQAEQVIYAVDSQHESNCLCVYVHLQLYKLQSALRDAGVTMYGGERASHALSIERAKSDRQVVNCTNLLCCTFWLWVLSEQYLTGKW